MLVDSAKSAEGQKAAIPPLSQRPKVQISVERIPYILSTADALTVLMVSLLGAMVYQATTGAIVPDLKPYVALGLIASVIFIVRISGQGYYEFERAVKPGIEVASVVICWVSTAFLLAFCAFIFKMGLDFSRGAVAVFAVVTPTLLLANRLAMKALLSKLSARKMIGHLDALIFADPQQMSALTKIGALGLMGIDQGKCFLISSSTEAAGGEPIDPVMLQKASDAIRKNSACDIFLLVPWNDLKRIEQLRAQLRYLPTTVKLLPDATMSELCELASSGATTRRSLILELQRPPLSSLERLVKRALDVAISLSALVFFSPLLLCTALAIKLDSEGPVIFRQSRNGFSGKTFTMFKFRTMSVQENGEDVQQATRNDPRVTSIGRLLRSSSIDELPQLINVLLGDMSLIGPRPHALAHDTHFMEIVANYAFRQHVKPGITGWAQVHGARGATPSIDTITKRVDLDIWYIDNWSLWLDFQILLMTLVEVLRKRNAY
jgi:undecaprenyl-phosphate galactose phosphotransferase/putative colanic acid biosynthesis UDP-glucose lipid carrier transferase